MHPIICSIGAFNIYSYGLMLATAFIISSTLAAQEAKRQDINPEIIYNFSFILIVSGIIGARIFYVVENIGYYLRNPLEIIMLQKGGLAWFGGLILSGIACVWYLKRRKLPLYRMMDLVIPYVALGQAIGRIGCLLNGCCFGKISRFGIFFASHGHILIPTQAYSSISLLLIFIILRIMQERQHKPGEIFFIYLLLYAIKRFFIEFWRADNPNIIFGITLFQVLSIVLFIFALIKLILIKKQPNSPTR